MEELNEAIPQPQRPEPRAAGFWLRLSAFCADVVVIWIGLGLIETLLWSFRPSEAKGLLSCVRYIGIPLYFIYPVMRSQQTFGQKLGGLTVVRVDFAPIGLGDAIKRFVFFVLTSPLSFINIFTVPSRGMALHDSATKTRVIESLPVPRGRAACAATLLFLLAFMGLRTALSFANSLEATAILSYEDIAEGLEKEFLPKD